MEAPKTIEGMQSFEQVKKSIHNLGIIIEQRDGLSHEMNACRISSMRSLMTLFEQYTKDLKRRKENENV